MFFSENGLEKLNRYRRNPNKKLKKNPGKELTNKSLDDFLDEWDKDESDKDNSDKGDSNMEKELKSPPSQNRKKKEK